MKMTEIIIIILITILAGIIILANRIRAKRRQNTPISICSTDDATNFTGSNVDSSSIYDARLLKKYESLSIWIKLRERYGRRLISYTVLKDKDADKVNYSRSPIGVGVAVRYIGDDKRLYTEQMFIKFRTFHDLSIVTMEEHEKLLRGEPVTLSVTKAEINSMRLRKGDVNAKSLTYTDEQLKEMVIRDKR